MRIIIETGRTLRCGHGTAHQSEWFKMLPHKDKVAIAHAVGKMKPGETATEVTLFSGEIYKVSRRKPKSR